MEYAAANHTGELMYIVTRPDANNVTKHNIEFAAYYTNVIPKTIPLGHFNFTEGTHDLAQLSIEFSGTMNISPAVDNMAEQLLTKTYSFVTEDGFDPNNSVGASFNTDHGNSDPHMDDYSEGDRSTSHDKITSF